MSPVKQRAGESSGSSEFETTKSMDLVRRAQEGDSGAFNNLCGRYYDRVRRIVRMRVGDALRKQVDESDILQDTFVVAVREFDKFEMQDEASLINWLATLAERQILGKVDYFAAQKRDPRREARRSTGPSLDDSGHISSHLAASADAPLERLSQRERESLVEECIGGLSSEYRELLILRNYVGASWEVIAEQTKRPSASAARMMHARALIELGRSLREKGLE